MKNNSLKIMISALLVFSLFIFPFKLNKTDAASDTLTKTVEFFAGQDGAVRTDGNQFSFSFANVIIPETAPLIKSAVVEINGVSYNSLGNRMINVDLKPNSGLAGMGINYTLAQNVKPKSFSIKHNALGVIDPVVSAYTLYLTGSSPAGIYSFSVFSAKLVLTYQYSSSSSGLLKTTKFFIEQKTDQIVSGAEINKPFTVFITEKSSPENIPLIRSVIVEVSGSARGGAVGTIETKVAKTGFDPGYSLYDLDMSSPSCGASCVAPFLVRYDASSVVAGSDFLGSANYTFYFKATGLDISLLSAKMIVTYKYSEIIGGLPAKGELISSTFDTGVIKGAAYNSVTWKGNLNGGVRGMVRLQLAASNCSGGQSDYPACVSGVWGDINTPYVGYSTASGCGSSVYLDALPDDPIEAMCAEHLNNKRYFRYKVIICSNSDCASGGLINPEVTDIIVNWAP